MAVAQVQGIIFPSNYFDSPDERMILDYIEKGASASH